MHKNSARYMGDLRRYSSAEKEEGACGPAGHTQHSAGGYACRQCRSPEEGDETLCSGPCPWEPPQSGYLSWARCGGEVWDSLSRTREGGVAVGKDRDWKRGEKGEYEAEEQALP